MTRLAPVCSNCGATDFVWANDLKTGGIGGGSLSLRSRGELSLGTRICRSCGHADLFLKDPSILRMPHTWKPGEFTPISPRPAPAGHHGTGAPPTSPPAPAHSVPPPPAPTHAHAAPSPPSAAPPPAPASPAPTPPPPAPEPPAALPPSPPPVAAPPPPPPGGPAPLPPPPEPTAVGEPAKKPPRRRAAKSKESDAPPG